MKQAPNIVKKISNFDANKFNTDSNYRIKYEDDIVRAGAFADSQTAILQGGRTRFSRKQLQPYVGTPIVNLYDFITNNIKERNQLFEKLINISGQGPIDIITVNKETGKVTFYDAKSDRTSRHKKRTTAPPSNGTDSWRRSTPFKRFRG